MDGKQKEAIQRVDHWLENDPQPDVFSQHWPKKLTKKIFREGLILRILNPVLIRQGQTNTCGPVTIMQILAEGFPRRYVDFACNLYLSGTSDLDVNGNTFSVTPKQSVKTNMPVQIENNFYERLTDWIHFAANSELVMADLHEVLPDDVFETGLNDEEHIKRERYWAYVDWVTAGSLRSSQNILDWKDKSSMGFGTTHIVKMSAWLRSLGFEHVKVRAYAHRRGKTNLGVALAAKNQGTLVVISIHQSVIQNAVQNDAGKHVVPAHQVTNYKPLPNHWVSLGNHNQGENVELFSYGKRYLVTKDQLVKGYFGHISAQAGAWGQDGLIDL